MTFEEEHESLTPPRRVSEATQPCTHPATQDYDTRLAAEREKYACQTDIHNLPAIFHYWSERFVRPMVEEFGFNLPEELFARYLALAAETIEGPSVFLSVGAGNCDIEIRTAQLICSRGIADFVIECLELNPLMLKRARASAEEAGVLHHLEFVEGDFNQWKPRRRYKAVVANQVLHHVMELEHLFAEIKRALHPAGFFVTGDMIGRNGHQRWPEALTEVQRFWRELPLQYRWNHQLNRFEEEYIDHDCSTVGFEGVRAQDILPLLLQSFDFHLFVPFGNVIDPFVDRSFGYNFDAKAAWDRAFIDRVHAFDEQAIVDGTLTPTHMYAVLTPTPCREHRFSRNLAPQRCVRGNAPARAESRNQLMIATPLLRPTEPRGTSYSQQLSASGGVPPYTWLATDLPAGLALSTHGVLNGSLACDGEFTPLIVVKDASRPAQAVAQRYTILEKPREMVFPLAILQAGELCPAIVGERYAQALMSCGGRLPVTWSVASGSLPRGLSLDAATGVISGEPLVTCRSAFTVRATDVSGQSVASELTLQTKPPEREFSRVGIFPHLSCDNDWVSFIHIVNPGPRSTAVAIEIRSGRGKLLGGSLNPPPVDCECHESGHYCVPPHSSLQIRIDPSQTQHHQQHNSPSWAEIHANGPVTAFLTCIYTSPQKTRSEVTLPLLQPGATELAVPFDNEGENRTGLALLNLSATQSDAVVAAVWDQTGKLAATADIPLAGRHHTAFMVRDRFPITVGGRGIVALGTLSGGPILATCLCVRATGIPLFLPAIPVDSREE